MTLTPERIKEIQERTGIAPGGAQAVQQSIQDRVSRRQQLAREYDEKNRSFSNPFVTTSDTPIDKSGSDFVKNTAKDLYKRGENLSTFVGGQGNKIAEEETILGKTALLGQTPLKTVGELGAGVGDIFMNAFESFVKPEIEDSKGYKDIKDAFKFENLAPEAQDFFKKLGEKAKQNPDVAMALEDALNSTGLLVPQASKAITEPVKKIAGQAAAQTTEAFAPVLRAGVEGVENVLEKRAQQSAIKAADDVADIVAPKVTRDVELQALKRGSAGVKEGGVLAKGRALPDTRTRGIRDAVVDSGVSLKKNDVVGNIDALNAKVSEINDGVRAMVSERKVPFNENQLRSKLSQAKDESRVIFGSDRTLEAQYDAIIDEFMRQMKGKDTAGLFDARQTFDRVIEQKFPGLLSSPAGDVIRRNAILDVRRAANEYISELLPANNPYKNAMMTEHRLLQAVENIAEKAVGTEVGKNAIINLVKKYPALRWIIGSAIGGGATGVLLN